MTQLDHNYRVRYQVMIRNKQVLKYETPYQGPYNTMHTCTNGMVTLTMGSITDIIDILILKHCYT